MPTNREVYFSLLKSNNKYLTRLVIKSLLNDANDFSDEISLFKAFDLDCPHYDEVMEKAERIKNGEPFQYVLGYANFIDRYFEVNPHVLIPRQETEQLVINTKLIIEKGFGVNPDISIADICTGSGCIAISLKRYFPASTVYASDIDQECLNTALRNAKSYKINFFSGDMLEPFIKNHIKIDVLVCNPPYIEREQDIDEQVWKYEPHLALLAKPDTTFYEKIFSQCDQVLTDKGVMIFEIGEDMEEKLRLLIDKYLTNVSVMFSKDLYNKLRFLYIIKKGEKNDA